MGEPFIVAEVSKNWTNGREVTPGSGLLASQFERVINRNHLRGYRLHSFQLHRQMTAPGELNETVIAVFEQVREALVWTRRSPKMYASVDHHYVIEQESTGLWRILKGEQPRGFSAVLDGALAFCQQDHDAARELSERPSDDDHG